MKPINVYEFEIIQGIFQTPYTGTLSGESIFKIVEKIHKFYFNVTIKKLYVYRMGVKVRVPELDNVRLFGNMSLLMQILVNDKNLRKKQALEKFKNFKMNLKLKSYI